MGHCLLWTDNRDIVRYPRRHENDGALITQWCILLSDHDAQRGHKKRMHWITLPES